MNKDCPEFERHTEFMARERNTGLTAKENLTGCTARERLEWETHLAHCPACRDQQAAEESIEGLFSKAVPPTLSSRFNENLRHRIAAERNARSRWPLLVMQGYWLTASLISAVILLNLEGLHARTGIAMMACLLLCFAGPALLMGRSLRFSLFDLILRTMTPTEKPVESCRRMGLN